MTIRRTLWMVLLCFACCTAAVRASGRFIARPDGIPNHFVVLLAGTAHSGSEGWPADGSQTGRIARELGRAYGAGISRLYLRAVPGFAAEMNATQAARLASDPRVALVEQDAWIHASATQIAPPSWGLDRIDQELLPLDGLYRYASDGAGVHVFVVDSGIRSTHVDFGGRVDTVDAFTTISDGNGTEDCAGHGTLVAGLIGGATYGVAKAVTLHPVRVLDCRGQGTLSDAIAGIDWVTGVVLDHQGGNPARRWRGVLNVSFEAPASFTLDVAVRRAIEQANVEVVVAAGNSGDDACNHSPSRVSEAIVVGASTEADERAGYSDFGPCVDLFAPGDQVTSTFIRSDTDAVVGSGSSFAAPHAAGVVAFLIGEFPDAAPAMIERVLEAYATPGVLSNLGAGSPNLLLYSFFQGDGVDEPPIAALAASCSRLHFNCAFDAGASLDDDGIASYAWDFGDGSGEVVRKGPRVHHKYHVAAPSFLVTLTVTDTAGHTATATQEVAF